MPFSGLSTNKLFVPNLVGEDVSEVLRTLTPYEAPFLDWIGDGDSFAYSTKHEYVEDFLRPRYIVSSGVMNSATANTGLQINGLGEALTVGTILELENTTPELLQVVSIPGPNSVLVSRNYDGSGIGSLVAGTSLYVRWPAAEEGHEHSGAHTARLGNRKANTVGYFSVEIATTGTQMSVNQYGGDSFDNARAKVFKEIPGILESEILRGKLNATNSLGTSTATRTMLGLRAQLTAINSTVAGNSFDANPHLYIGNIAQACFDAGASIDETWGIVAGTSFFRSISNLNDSKVQDSNVSELFKRVIRTYEGPFGRCTLFLSRALPSTELLLVPRERFRVVPLQGRNFTYQEMGVTGDNKKGMVVGEYTNEVYHPSAMGRLRV